MNQIGLYYKINDSYQFIEVTDEQDKFKTFINGFRIIFINSKEIKHIFIDDRILVSQPLTTNLKQLTDQLLTLIKNKYDLAITSDIHLHQFHLKLTFELAKSKQIKHVVINGDVLFKIPYSDQQPSRKKATDEICKILNDNLNIIHEAETFNIKFSDLSDNDKVIWLSGNHDKVTSLAPSFPKLETLIKHLAFVYECKIGKFNFRIQHGALMNELDPRITRPEELSNKYDKYMTGNNYLVLGHSYDYCMYNNEEIINEYKEVNKHNVFYISIGTYTKTDEYVENGPEYIVQIDSALEERGQFDFKLAFDLHLKCTESNFKTSHLLCTDNIRCITPINTNEDFYQFEMYGAGLDFKSMDQSKKKKMIITIVAAVVIVVVVIIVVCVVSNRKKKNGDNKKA